MRQSRKPQPTKGPARSDRSPVVGQRSSSKGPDPGSNTGRKVTVGPAQKSQERAKGMTKDVKAPSTSKPISTRLKSDGSRSSQQLDMKPTVRGSPATGKKSSGADMKQLPSGKQPVKAASTKPPPQVTSRQPAPSRTAAKPAEASKSSKLTRSDTPAVVNETNTSSDIEEEYESDFMESDSYSEDFSSMSSTEDDEQPPLGVQGNKNRQNTDNNGPVHSAEQLKEFESIRTAMKKENESLQRRIQQKPPAALKQEYSSNEKPPVPRPGTSVIQRRKHVNFSAAKETRFVAKSIATARRRGQELLQMIRLDTVQFSLFQLEPVNYDMYMKSYGRANTMQALIQTNEDTLSQEVQTDEIVMHSKWTQKPTECDSKTIVAGGIRGLSQHYLGVGGDSVATPIIVTSTIPNDALASATRMMIKMLEQQLQRQQRQYSMDRTAVKFSQSMMRLGSLNLRLLARLSITHAFYHASQRHVLLTVHTATEKGDTSDNKYPQSIICIWNITEPSTPQHVLVSPEQITCSCSGYEATLVFAGLADGCVAVWDTRDMFGKSYVMEDDHEITLSAATFLGGWTSRGKQESEDAHGRHTSPVVAIITVPASDMAVHGHTLYRVCSLEQHGVIHVWVTHYKRKINEINDALAMGQQSMHSVVLHHVSSLTVGIFGDEPNLTAIQCYEMKLSTMRDHLFIGMDCGWVAHCRLDEGRAIPEYYRQDIGTCGAATSIEPCPFQQPFFLVGTMDGKVRWHSSSAQKSLMEWDVPGGQSVVAVQWSRSRPCVIFVLDNASNIHIWDLAVGDVHPVETIRIEGARVTTMTLSEHDKHGIDFIVLGQDNGNVEVHRINATYSTPNEEAQQQELEGSNLKLTRCKVFTPDESLEYKVITWSAILGNL